VFVCHDWCATVIIHKHTHTPAKLPLRIIVKNNVHSITFKTSKGRGTDQLNGVKDNDSFREFNSDRNVMGCVFHNHSNRDINNSRDTGQE
jgi:hypothetical protein